MKIIPLKEGNYAVNKQKEFRLLHTVTDPAGELKMAVQPFLVITDKDYILLDTGLAGQVNGKPLIHECLSQAGVAPEQITKVLISHLHKDHIEGIGEFDGKTLKPHFPNAKVYLQQREYEFALEQTNNLSYNTALISQIPTLKVAWLNADKGQIGDDIFFEVTGGHSLFHQVFWIKNQTQVAFYGADNLPQQYYLKHQVAYKSDTDGKRALELRQRWQKSGSTEHWTILLYHDMEQPLIHLGA